MTWGPLFMYYECPKCGKSLFRKKGRGYKVYCSNSECDYEKAGK